MRPGKYDDMHGQGLLEWIVERLPVIIHRQNSGFLNYLIPMVLMGIALLLRLEIAPVSGGLQYVTFFPAVTLTAVICGLWPGLFATLLGLALATFIFTPPYYSFSFAAVKTSMWSDLIFFMDGVIVCATIEALHRFRARFEKELSASIQRESELQKISAIIASSEDAIIGITLDGTITSWNEGAQRIIGFAPEEVLGQSVYLMIPENYQIEENSLLERVRKGELVKHYETVRIHKNGKLIDISVTLSPILDSNGIVVGASKITRDITERKKNEAELVTAAAAFETYDAIMITDANSNIIKVNHAFTKVTGYKADEVLGKTPRLLSSGKHDKAFFDKMFQKLSQDGSWIGEVWDKHKDGEIYPTMMTITAVKNERHVLTNYVAIFNDITDRKQNEELINRYAFYDALTQLPNRRLLDDRLEQAIATSKRSGNYGALMFLDLDNFKPLNDTHGHKAGDLLLVEVARRITSCVREVDTVARFGGDEFVVLLSELNVDETESIAQAGFVAEKIRTYLSQPYWLTSNPTGSTKMIVHQNLGASIGVALFNEKTNAGQLLKYADKAMYNAKESGRNSVCFYSQSMM